MDNTEQFLKELNDFKKEIHEERVDFLKFITRLAVETLVFYSPIVTGRYVASHRVGINGPSSDPPEMVGGSPIAAKSITKGKAEAVINMINEDTKEIVIENNIHYNVNVEFGWASGKGGYYPYTNTANALRTAVGTT